MSARGPPRVQERPMGILLDKEKEINVERRKKESDKGDGRMAAVCGAVIAEGSSRNVGSTQLSSANERRWHRVVR